MSFCIALSIEAPSRLLHLALTACRSMCELIRRIIIKNIQDREDFLHVLRCLGALITAAGTCVPKLGIGCDARATGPSGVFQLDFLRSGGPEPSACLCFSTESTLTITERDSVCVCVCE